MIPVTAQKEVFGERPSFALPRLTIRSWPRDANLNSITPRAAMAELRFGFTTMQDS
jgi:hypothetical protein